MLANKIFLTSSKLTTEIYSRQYTHNALMFDILNKDFQQNYSFTSTKHDKDFQQFEFH